MDVISIDTHRISYALLPYKRNRDVIRIHRFFAKSPAAARERDDISVLVRTS